MVQFGHGAQITTGLTKYYFLIKTIIRSENFPVFPDNWGSTPKKKTFPHPEKYLISVLCHQRHTRKSNLWPVDLFTLHSSLNQGNCIYLEMEVRFFLFFLLLLDLNAHQLLCVRLRSIGKWQKRDSVLPTSSCIFQSQRISSFRNCMWFQPLHCNCRTKESNFQNNCKQFTCNCSNQ